MVNKKHQRHLNDIFLYIFNRITASVDAMEVKEEVLDKFYAELAWFDVLPEMHENFVEELCLQAYLYITKRIYGDEDAI